MFICDKSQPSLIECSTIIWSLNYTSRHVLFLNILNSLLIKSNESQTWSVIYHCEAAQQVSNQFNSLNHKEKKNILKNGLGTGWLHDRQTDWKTAMKAIPPPPVSQIGSYNNGRVLTTATLTQGHVHVCWSTSALQNLCIGFWHLGFVF